MTANLNVAIQGLKQAIAENGDSAPVVIEQGALEQQFHGLTLRQLALLTDAPALVVASDLRTQDGGHVERFAIEGNDPAPCELTARQILLAPEASLDAGDIREVSTHAGNALGQTFVRDHNDIVYRLANDQATIDPDLTGALQRHRQPVAEGETPAASPQTVTIRDALAFCGTAGEVLYGLAAMRERNAIAVQEVHKLVRATGEKDLESALAAAEPELLLEVVERIMLASRQIETLLDAVAQRVRALLRSVDHAGSEPEPAAVSSAIPEKWLPGRHGTEKAPCPTSPSDPGVAI